MPSDRLNLLFVTAEIAPWVKTGGLGDVASALPAALAQAGCIVKVLVPRYPALAAAFGTQETAVCDVAAGGCLPTTRLSHVRLGPNLELLLLDGPGFSDRAGNPYVDPNGRDWPDNLQRFGALSRVAALIAADFEPLAWRPDVIHCNDWQAALAPAFLRHLHGGRGAASVVAVHNLAFQGLFGHEALAVLGLPEHAWTIDGVEFHGRLSFLKAGLQVCDRIVTVSPTYAREILSPDYGCGLEGLLQFRQARLHGILNGIDTCAWDPSRDPALVRPYDAGTLDAKAENRSALQRELGLAPQHAMPVIGVVSRLTAQKGLDLLLSLADELCARGVQIALLGTGEAGLEQGWTAFAARHPGHCAVRIGFDETLAHRIEAGADLFAMPSRFEPCGLNQMYSLRYGTPPIVRHTGGLADTVVETVDGEPRDGRAPNGFVFEAPTATALLAAIDRAIACWRDPSAFRRLQRAGMTADFGWQAAASGYLSLYGCAIEDRRARGGR